MSNASELRSVRIVWKGIEHVWRYSVEIHKLENGSYKNYLQEFTASTFLNVTLLPGEYRFRIIAHDILDRPGEPSLWVNFTVKLVPLDVKTSDVLTSVDDYKKEQIEIIEISETEEKTEQITENNEQLMEHREVPGAAISQKANSARFNSVGASLETAFIDPLIIASIHGTFAPMNSFFIELGCDTGFISVYDYVDNFYSLYPYVNFCYFLPFANKGGIFAGAGAGYILGSYQFSHGGNADLNIFTFNFTAGVNIIDFINLSYSLKTDFTAVTHQIAVGYVYRFRQE